MSSLPFNLLPEQDVFGTYWVPSGNPTEHQTGRAKTWAWTILKRTLHRHWLGKPFDNRNSVIYLYYRALGSDQLIEFGNHFLNLLNPIATYGVPIEFPIFKRVI